MSLNDARAKRGVEPDAEQWAGTFESAPLAMSFAMPDGRLVRVNDAYCDMLGYRRDELLGRSFQELTHPDDIDADVALLGEILGGRRSQYNLEKRFLHADGHVVWARLAVTLVRSDDGQPLYSAAFLQEITDLKTAEDDLRVMEGRFRSAFDHAPIGLSLVSPEGRYIEVNPAMCEYLGRSAGELEGADFQAVTHPEDVAEDVDLMKRGLDGEFETYQVDERFIHADGRMLWGRVNAALVRDDEGRPSACVKRSRNRARLGRPVRGSWRAWWARRASACLRSMAISARWTAWRITAQSWSRGDRGSVWYSATVPRTWSVPEAMTGIDQHARRPWLTAASRSSCHRGSVVMSALTTASRR